MPTSRSWFFYLCALEGAAAIAALLLIPSEGGRISIARLGLITLIFLISSIWIVVGARRPQVLQELARPAVLIGCVVLSLAFGLSLFLLRYIDPENSLSTYQRLSPLLWYFLLLSIQSFFLLLFL